MNIIQSQLKFVLLMYITHLTTINFLLCTYINNYLYLITTLNFKYIYLTCDNYRYNSLNNV